MQFVPTNNAFRDVIMLLQIHKDKELIIEIFDSAGIKNVTNSKIKAWQTKAGKKCGMYREMPREAYDAFILELHKRKLVTLE
jgi:hypothetical protein